jgi:hypothetical protein
MVGEDMEEYTEKYTEKYTEEEEAICGTEITIILPYSTEDTDRAHTEE